MGAAQSTPEQQQPATHELNQQMLDRLRSLELQNKQRRQDEAASGAEKEYVMVRRDDAPPPYDYSNKSQTLEPMSHDVNITAAEQWQHELLRDPKNQLALSAFTTNAANAIISHWTSKITHPQAFNIHIPLEGSPVTNQKASGRCWLFASTNVFRIPLMKRYNLSSFELSQAYLFFWDKLEKANYFLESVLDTLDEPLSGRLLESLMAQPVGDGGQWDMVANLVQKYGLVPHDLYPDSFNAENSAVMSRLITTKLREDAIRLRTLAKSSHLNATAQDKKTSLSSSLAAAKTSMLREVHQILVLMLGPPPSPQGKFKWEYTSSVGQYHQLSLTPLEFASSLNSPKVVRTLGGADVHRLFSLVNDPRHDHNTLLTVERLGNVYGGLPIRYVNVPMTVMKTAVIRMLGAGVPVFFGCDVGKYSDPQQGVMDPGLYDYELGFNVRLSMSKAERLRTGESAMTHAMVLTGVQVDRGTGLYQDECVSTRWRVENSWSASAGDQGYFVMSDEWMDEFVYQVVVDPSFVPKDVSDVLDQEPTVLPLWDPMGALA